MAVVRVQAANAQNSSLANNVSATLNGVAAGNLLTVGAFAYLGGNPTATCSDGTSYTKTPNSPGSDNNISSTTYIFYLANANAGSHTATVTWNASANAGNLGIWLTEWSGILTASPLDVDQKNTTFPGPGQNTHISVHPSITPTATGELLYCFLTPAATLTSVNSPWTQGVITAGDGDGYILSGTTSPTAVDGTQSVSNSWSAIAVAFKLAAAIPAITGYSTTAQQAPLVSFGD